jgi:hypothetical protein
VPRAFGRSQKCSYIFATLVGMSVIHSALSMPRDKTLRVRLNQREFDKIQLLAQQHDVPMSEVVRDLIKQLPEPSTEALYLNGDLSQLPLHRYVQRGFEEVER